MYVCSCVEGDIGNCSISSDGFGDADCVGFDDGRALFEWQNVTAIMQIVA